MAERYKTFNAAASFSIQKISCEQLKVGVPHFVLKLSETSHEKFGLGLKAVICDSAKIQMFTFLPPRIRKKLSDADVKGFQEDINSKKPPLLIFFGKTNNAFDIQMLPFSKDLADKALKGIKIEKPEQQECLEKETKEEENLDWLDSLNK